MSESSFHASSDDAHASSEDDRPRASQLTSHIHGTRPLQSRASSTSGQESRKRRERQSVSHDELQVTSSILTKYRDLLNDVIHEATRLGEIQDPLPDSQIGASYWTSAEKEAFFAKLDVCDAGDLRALSLAVGTKSEAECHVYLRILQEAVVEASATLTGKRHFSLADAPAAYEVSVGCDRAIYAVVETLRQRIEDQDELIERGRHGDLWLINDGLAATIEQEIAADSSLTTQAASPLLGEEHGDCMDSETDPTLLALPAARLLNPSAFLDLSQRLFMNASLESGQHWTQISPTQDPAIYRTAFDDFHNLAISLTRRIVQATLFQATTRLRASDAARTDVTPKPFVRAVDVRTTLDLLNLKPLGARYWAQVVRDQGIEVYSDAKQYKDGRSGTKIGVKLTPDEFTTALLGVNQHSTAETAATDDEFEIGDVGSDAYTSQSDDGAASDDGNVNSEADASADEQPSKRRRNVLSPNSLLRAERRYLERLDLLSSSKEEQALWKMMEQVPPPVRDFEDSKVLEHTSKDGGHSHLGWRDRVTYQANWEHLPEFIDEHSFSSMHARGQKRKLQRLGAQAERSELDEYRYASRYMSLIQQAESTSEQSSDEHHSSHDSEPLDQGEDWDGRPAFSDTDLPRKVANLAADSDDDDDDDEDNEDEDEDEEENENEVADVVHQDTNDDDDDDSTSSSQPASSSETVETVKTVEYANSDSSAI